MEIGLAANVFFFSIYFSDSAYNWMLYQVYALFLTKENDAYLWRSYIWAVVGEHVTMKYRYVYYTRNPWCKVRKEYKVRSWYQGHSHRGMTSKSLSNNSHSTQAELGTPPVCIPATCLHSHHPSWCLLSLFQRDFLSSLTALVAASNLINWAIKSAKIICACY